MRVQAVVGPEAVLENEGEHHDEAGHDRGNAHVTQIALHFLLEEHQADLVGLPLRNVQRIVKQR